MGYKMESGILRVVSKTRWWPLAVRMATNLLLYWSQYFVFPVVFGNYFSGTFNLIPYLYGGEPVLVCTGCEFTSLLTNVGILEAI